MSSTDRTRLLEEMSARNISSSEEHLSNQACHHFSPVDINQLLHQDEQEVVSKNKIIYVDSDGEEVDTEDASPSAESSTPSIIPYVHPLVLLTKKT